MNAFITGSRVYGKPKPDSDIDLVVFADYQTRTMLESMSDDKPSDPFTPTTIRFGKLNVIVCEDFDEFVAWRAGTREMLLNLIENGHKSTREEAKAKFDEYESKLGVHTNY